MAKRRIEFTKEQIEEINQARKTNKNKNTERRLKVLSMKAVGESLEETIVQTGYNATYARSLVTKYFKEGLEAIIGKKRHANNRNMSYDEESAVIEGFIERAKKGEIITVKDIKAAYEAKVGHAIGKGHIYVILHRHDWRKIKPRPEHPQKASEAEIEASKKLTLA